jgi:lipopolysaccharide export system permease protein
MANDRELIILEGVGVGKAFQMSIVTQFTVIFCLFVTLITLYAAPWAEQNIHNLKERAKEESDISGIKPGQFKEFSQGDRVVYVQNFSPEKTLMEDVFLQVRQENNLGVLASDNARFQFDRNSGNKYIIFSDGQRYVGEPGLLDYEITEYEKYAILIENVTKKSEGVKTAALTTAKIIGSGNMTYEAEFQWRISLIILCLYLSLFSVLLVQSGSTEKRYTPFIIGISVYLIYSNLLGIAQTLLRREIIPEFMGLWWVHIIFILVLFVLYYLPQIQLEKNKL